MWMGTAEKKKGKVIHKQQAWKKGGSNILKRINSGEDINKYITEFPLYSDHSDHYRAWNRKALVWDHLVHKFRINFFSVQELSQSQPAPFPAQAPESPAGGAWGAAASRICIWRMERSSPQSRDCVTARGMWTHKLMSFQHTEMERFCRKLLFII